MTNIDIEKLKIGDIGFSFNKTKLISRLIYLVSIKNKHLKKPKKQLSHSFIYLGNNLIAEATFTGVIIVNIRKYINSKYDIEFQTPVKHLTASEQDKIFEFAADHAGLTQYSFGQLFVILFNKWFKTRRYDFSQKEMMCSEFVCDAYEYINRVLVNNDSSMTDPIELYESEEIRDIE